jgi:pimeloyl-ACP methyl ester carboxylesterase
VNETMGALDVPGATLYYEKRGSGPLLVFVAGGNGDAGPFGGVARILADRYTTVAYDRRGFSRSPVDGPVDNSQRVATDLADLAALIDELGGEPSYVFGSSSGAIVALNFLNAHPDKVAKVVAHEPPLFSLIPEGEEIRRTMDGVYETFRAKGYAAAMGEFGKAMGIGGQRPTPGGDIPAPMKEMLARMEHNLPFFLEHELRVYTGAVPDLDALASRRDRIVLAGGEDSREFPPYQPNKALAKHLDLTIQEFPGDHAGYGPRAAEFAARLAEVL